MKLDTKRNNFFKTYARVANAITRLCENLNAKDIDFLTSLIYTALNCSIITMLANINELCFPNS